MKFWFSGLLSAFCGILRCPNLWKRPIFYLFPFLEIDTMMVSDQKSPS